MDKIIIKGGKKLKGAVRISGSKNAALPLIAATVLTDEDCILKNIPDLVDIRTMLTILEGTGKKCIREKGRVIIKKSGEIRPFAPYDLVRKMRASIVFLGPLLARCRVAMVSLPGGCAIGSRPVNIHLDGLKALGAREMLESGYVNLSAKKLKGTRIVFDYPSVGATENILMASVLAEGVTVIENYAREPEIDDLVNFLNTCGATISFGKDCITVRGVEKMQGAEYSVIPDRIEAGTYLLAGAVTGGDVTLNSVCPRHIDNILSKLKETGCAITETENTVRIRASAAPKSVDVSTLPYPGFPTDMQAQWMVLMCRAKGDSRITESVFENRFMHVQELTRMGADIRIKGNAAVIRGGTKFIGASVMATDLRASAALILAGLVAKGRTEILRVYHLDRGYEKIEEKLRKLGADISRIRE